MSLSGYTQKRAPLSLATGLYCKACGSAFDLGIRNACDECFASVEIRYDMDEVSKHLTKESIRQGPASIWRYWPLLPAGRKTGERGLNPGFTPLRECRNLAGELGLKHLYVKDDTVNPTYSFKDRPVATSAAAAVELGLNGLGCASTGNLAGATAAAAARYGLPSIAIIPKGLDANKVIASSVYGSSIVEVEGSYDNANRIANLIADRYRVGFVNINLRPFYIEGSKTLSFEVIEQLNWQEPDRIIVPMGSGALLTAVSRGIEEFRYLDLSEGRTLICGTQPMGCSPISRAFQEGSEIRPVKEPRTVAESLAIGDPASGDDALRAIRESGGYADAISDREICEAQLLLARKEGIFTEPAGGTVVASLIRNVESGVISPSETVVCLITGNGLKVTSHLSSSVSTVKYDGSFSSMDAVLSSFQKV